MLPILNDTKKPFTSRDNLGINSATSSLQADLCPVVNTVTPRAFYWPFLVWNYYDYHKNSGAQKKDIRTFEIEYLKKNDYFFVLGNLLSGQTDEYNLVGKENTRADIAPGKEFYSYNRKYFIASFGGMQYYTAGCDTLGFVTSEDGTGRTFDFPLITENLGKPLAEAFEDAIKHTEYFKSYRFSEGPVPTKAIIEFGKTVNLSMDHLSECKRLMREALFTPTQNIRLINDNLISSANYVKYIHDIYGGGISSEKLRNILYQVFSVRGECESLSSELNEISKKWEIAIGRQYLTLAIELIWKELLDNLLTPIPMKAWVEETVKSSAFYGISLDAPIKTQAEKEDLSSDAIETMIQLGYRNRRSDGHIIERSMQILFALYSRFRNRDDLDQVFLNYGGDISLLGLITEIDNNPNMTAKEFIWRIAHNWILKRHLEVAREKMYYGRDGYYFSMTDGLCCFRYKPYPEFQGNRLVQLTHVMKDLDML